jgi:hypothetical protein
MSLPPIGADARSVLELRAGAADGFAFADQVGESLSRPLR